MNRYWGIMGASCLLHGSQREFHTHNQHRKVGCRSSAIVRDDKEMGGNAGELVDEGGDVPWRAPGEG